LGVFGYEADKACSCSFSLVNLIGHTFKLCRQDVQLGKRGHLSLISAVH
jgi:hypothetical protein